MAGGTITARAGAARVDIDISDVIRQADQLVDGAVSSFIAAAHRQMDPVVAEARTGKDAWPRKTGASAAGTVIVDSIGPDFVAVTAKNEVPYTYKLRFSTQTRESMNTDAAHFAGFLWGKIGPAVDLGKSPNAKSRIAHHFLRRTKKGKDASAGVWNGWWPKTEPSEASIRASRLSQLIQRHGQGAPSEAVAGKHVWSVAVRLPVLAREAALVKDAAAALDKLAGAT